MSFFTVFVKKKICKSLPCIIFSFSRGLSSSTHNENKVLKHLRAKIEATGPISVADYMRETLISPYAGYYMKQDVFGNKGDFITSPEISQMFGELIGIWFCNEWLKAGKPHPLQFVEFGPGRGTLADDILRSYLEKYGPPESKENKLNPMSVFSKVLPVKKTDLSVHLIEVSPFMKKLQMKNLISENNTSSDPALPASESECNNFLTKHGYSLQFHECLETVPENFSLFLAHEFFDALPIHKFQKTEDGWKEVLIDFKNGELQLVLSRNATPAAKFLIDADEKRDHLEICPDAGLFTEKICKRMKEDGGITLIVDYGHVGNKTDTFRSFKQHKLHDPLKDPGEADLTADVDFSYVRKCVKDEGYVVGPVTQAHFLKNMGIEIRLEKLLERATPEIQKSLKSGYSMLTEANQMGERFKFLAIYPKVLEFIIKKYPPAGF